jgi:hypothetical protein
MMPPATPPPPPPTLPPHPQQRFLATINSTVIDWFQPWPEVSLLSVARKFLDGVDLVSDAVRSAVVEFMPFSFATVNKVRGARSLLGLQALHPRDHAWAALGTTRLAC